MQSNGGRVALTNPHTGRRERSLAVVHCVPRTYQAKGVESSSEKKSVPILFSNYGQNAVNNRPTKMLAQAPQKKTTSHRSGLTSIRQSKITQQPYQFHVPQVKKQHPAKKTCEPHFGRHVSRSARRRGRHRRNLAERTDREHTKEVIIKDISPHACPQTS